MIELDLPEDAPQTLLAAAAPHVPPAVPYGTGRRKTSVARVRLTPGTGKITINGRDVEEFFCNRFSLLDHVRRPFVATGETEKWDVFVRVRGGGVSGQAGAVRHGIARALLHSNPDLRPVLRKAGLLTRDSRMVERKKYGQPGARKRFQFSKR